MSPQARKWIDENKSRPFYDVNNGRSRPMTAEQVFEEVTGNPCCSNPEEPFYYTHYRGSSGRPLVEEILYSVQNLVDIFGIDLEQELTK